MTAASEELVAKLNRERERLMTALEGVDAEMATRRIEGEDGWTSIHDAMKHVASAEKSMFIVATRSIAGTFQRVEGFDLNRFNARQVEKRAAQSWEETLTELREVRAETVAALQGWTQQELETATHHPVWGETTVEGLVRIMAIHDGLHRKDVEKLRATQPISPA